MAQGIRYCSLMLILGAVAFAGIGCEQIKPRQKPGTKTKPTAKQEPVASQEAVKDAEPPLLLDNEPFLLLDKGRDIASPAGPIADNSRCHVCHINYMQEDIAIIHGRANIGCAGCHGTSDAHIADESWSWGGKGTAPDIMYRRSEINPFCMGCHPKDKSDTEQHKPLFAGTGVERYCTDCHGKHRLAQRKCKWK